MQFASMALTFVTLDEFKTRLGITSSTQDASLTAVLSGVEALIRIYLGYDPAVSVITAEYLDTTNTPTVALKRWPVMAVVSVYEDHKGNYGFGPDAFPASSLLVPGENYDLVIDQQSRAGVLLRVARYWPGTNTKWPNQLMTLPGVCPGCVKVSYTIDNSEIMAVANQAALLEATTQYRAQLTGSGIITSDSMDGASVGVSPMPNAQRVRDSRDNFVSPATANMLRPFASSRRFV
jgi:hypothetical protein